MKKKLLKLFNIFLLIFIFFVIFELFCNYFFSKLHPDFADAIKNKMHFGLLPYKKIIPFSQKLEFEFTKNKEKIYPAKNAKKGAVAIVGCSCTEGIGLSYEQTFAANINKLTGRKVYSRAKSWRGLPYVYYQVDKKLIPYDTQYIIYVFIFNHLQNLYSYYDLWDNIIMLHYYEKNGNVIQNNPKMLFPYSLYSYKLLMDYITYLNFKKELTDFKLYSFLITKLVEKLKENYPGTKLIVLQIQVEEDFPVTFPKILENKLKSMGVTVLNAEQLTGDKYYLPKNKLTDEKIHPNADVWTALTPKIIQATGL